MMPNWKSILWLSDDHLQGKENYQNYGILNALVIQMSWLEQKFRMENCTSSLIWALKFLAQIVLSISDSPAWWSEIIVHAQML